MSSTRWYVMQLQASLLNTAEFHLKRQHFEYFVPKIQLKNLSVVPMFSGYGFVQLDIGHDSWGSINGTRGVVGLLPRHSSVPQPMIEGFVEYLREHDPLPVVGLENVVEMYYPGITRVLIQRDHLLSGRRGLVIAVRANFLQLSLGWKNDVWVSKSQVKVVEEV